VKLLGERAKEFLVITDNKYRLFVPREDCTIPENSLGVFEAENLGNFEIINKEQMSKLKSIK
jgi:hypothetical protein